MCRLYCPPNISGDFFIGGKMQIRKLTIGEKRAVRRMVRTMCANYDDEHGCLPLDGGCFMLGKLYNNNILCRWFRNSLMPASPELEHIFTGKAMPDMKRCQCCSKPFPAKGRKAYCSEKCSKASRLESAAINARAYRRRKRQRNQLALENALSTMAAGQELREAAQ